MREEDLRAVLLVKAIEETDREAAIVPAADRQFASRQAKRAFEGAAGAPGEGPLAHRARSLLAKVVVRHPFVAEVLEHSGGIAWIGVAAIVAGLLFGIGLSALDGTRRINVLAFPLLALVLWNLAVYAWMLLPGPRGESFRFLAVRSAMGRVSALIARSKSFDAPLATALAQFAREWQQAAKPLLLARAARMFHLAAAAVGLGLIAGLYLRGIAFAYQAGWESTFLDAAHARQLLGFMYGPASWLTGIPIPDAAQLEAIRWREGRGGEPAGRWIHLLAATAAIFIVIPRAILALVATATIARRSRHLQAPPALGSYARIAFSGVGGLVDRGIVVVIPLAYEPDPNALARLRALLAKEMGEHLAIDLRPPLRYGDEESFVKSVGEQGPQLADVVVLLVNLAATPEDENHGTVIEGVRDWLARSRPQAQLVVFADEGPYATRMGSERIEERRRAWRDFIAARGVEPRFVDLAR